MLRQYLALPAPLRIRTLLWSMLALCALGAGIYAAFRMGWMLCLPLLAMSAALLLDVYTLLCGKYLAIACACIKIERNITHNRTKWIILKNTQCTLRIRLKRRQAEVQPGDRVTVYLRSKSRLYEMDEMFTVYDYIAIKSEGVLYNG